MQYMHSHNEYKLLYQHNNNDICLILKGRNMFFNSIIEYLQDLNHSDYDKIDPNLVKYFKTEYGKNWKAELEYYLYNERNKNDKKAA